MAKTVDPGAPENLHSENALKGSVTKKDESAAHSIQARSSLLQPRPNTFAQTNSVFLTFRLQNGGGPYIPVRWLDAHNLPSHESKAAEKSIYLRNSEAPR